MIQLHIFVLNSILLGNFHIYKIRMLSDYKVASLFISSPNLLRKTTWLCKVGDGFKVGLALLLNMDNLVSLFSPVKFNMSLKKTVLFSASLAKNTSGFSCNVCLMLYSFYVIS